MNSSKPNHGSLLRAPKSTHSLPQNVKTAPTESTSQNVYFMFSFFFSGLTHKPEFWVEGVPGVSRKLNSTRGKKTHNFKHKHDKTLQVIGHFRAIIHKNTSHITYTVSKLVIKRRKKIRQFSACLQCARTLNTIYTRQTRNDKKFSV